MVLRLRQPVSDPVSGRAPLKGRIFRAVWKHGSADGIGVCVCVGWAIASSRKVHRRAGRALLLHVRLGSKVA